MARYPDLKSYFQANYNKLLKNEVQRFVDKSYDGNGFHGINVLSLCKHEIENFTVKTLCCHDDIGPRVKIDISVSADIVDLGLGTKRIEADRKTRWFTVYIQAVLQDSLTNVVVLDTKEFFGGHFEKENALDQFLVPYIYTADLEEKADDFTLFYCSDAIYNGYMLPVYDILRALEVDYYIADLPKNCFGRMYFRSSVATVYQKHPYMGEMKMDNHAICPGTILVSRQRYFLGNDGTQRLTIAHEIIHWYLHQKYFKLLALLDDERDMMSCESEPDHYDEEMTLAQKAHWFAEWQANALAIRIAMPRELMLQAFCEVKEAASPYHFTGEYIEDILRRVSGLFDVPMYAVKQRARQLDFDVADGAFVSVDGKHYDSFSFSEGILGQHQTFVIDHSGFENVYSENSGFAELIDSGKFVYLGYVVCINDPKYVTVDSSYKKARLILTDYAREHADECCLVFSWRSTSYLKDMYEFYGQAYLNKEVTADYYVEHTYDKDFNFNCVQTAESIMAAVKDFSVAHDVEKQILTDMMQRRCETFSTALTYHMDRKKITVDDLVERAGLSDTTIKNYRAGKVQQPPIENVMAICIGLNLPKTLAVNLLSTASYNLNDSPRDRAYKFLLDYSDGTLQQWNMILDAFNQPHIPYIRNQKTK
jgi:transcriptional regulator with XRE-family HTH domain